MMQRTPYDRFSEEEMILRDHLAVDRTILANERTLLSYVRTALGLVAAGFTLLHFFDGSTTTVLGWLLPRGPDHRLRSLPAHESTYREVVSPGEEPRPGPGMIPFRERCPIFALATRCRESTAFGRNGTVRVP
ncbi:MAG: DUF202 domain-containing protein [Chloroflexi bacterium]|nr:DUF202 domain-containing protein [Chloroflexota bacterium]